MMRRKRLGLDQHGGDHTERIPNEFEHGRGLRSCLPDIYFWQKQQSEVSAGTTTRVSDWQFEVFPSK